MAQSRHPVTTGKRLDFGARPLWPPCQCVHWLSDKRKWSVPLHLFTKIMKGWIWGKTWKPSRNSRIGWGSVVQKFPQIKWYLDFAIIRKNIRNIYSMNRTQSRLMDVSIIPLGPCSWCINQCLGTLSSQWLRGQSPPPRQSKAKGWHHQCVICEIKQRIQRFLRKF